MFDRSGEKRVAVVDYGLGNLFSISRALAHVGAQVEVVSSADGIMQAQGLILPGVGAFGDGIEHLRASGLIGSILQFAESGRPLLGICLGMQLLFEESEEFGVSEGLGLIEGKVVRLCNIDSAGQRVKVPHIGWSSLLHEESTQMWDHTVLERLCMGSATYFVHSYTPIPIRESEAIAQIIYGDQRYCAAVRKDNITGVQFHPEKSGEVGLHILRNYVRSIH